MLDDIKRCFQVINLSISLNLDTETRQLYLPLGLFRGSSRLGIVCFGFLKDRFNSITSPLSLDPLRDMPRLFNAWLMGQGPHQEQMIIPTARTVAARNGLNTSNPAIIVLESVSDDDGSEDRRVIVLNTVSARSLAYELSVFVLLLFFF